MRRDVLCVVLFNEVMEEGGECVKWKVCALAMGHLLQWSI